MQKNETGIFYPASLTEWRKWLEKNHLSKQAVWLVFYTHAKKQFLFLSHDSYQETYTALLSRERHSKSQKEILMILNKWKKDENLSISSHLLKNLIMNAYACNQNSIPYGITRKIIMVLCHIEQYIDCIHLVSVENTNNILTDIPISDKTEIRRACKKKITDLNINRIRL